VAGVAVTLMLQAAGTAPGGDTGDTLGALPAAGELAALLVFLALLNVF